MHRVMLDAPRTLSLEAAPRSMATGQPAHARLDAALPAWERRRRLFHPERGWLRRLERGLSCWLSAAIYPRIPGLTRVYDRQLARDLTVSEGEIALPGLPREFAGVRFLLVTDIHAGAFVSPAGLERALGRLLTIDADVILLGGDLVTSRLVEYEQHERAFASLRAPLGVFAVLGNHDHYTGAPDLLRRKLEASGIRVLCNESAMLVRGTACLSLAGVDDPLMGRPDIGRALAGTRPPVVLLSHNPDLFFRAARAGVALMLSGHTHAGQIRIPRLPVLVRQSRYRLDEGRYRIAATELVVSRGLGAVGLPWRIACSPEAILLTLRASE